MRKFFLLSIIFIATLALNSCWSVNNNLDDQSVNNYKPIIIERSVFENSVKTLPTQTIIKSGKIYIKDNLMFINDVNKGFHVYNYSNTSNPVNIGFIQILGATDLAIKDNIIYINQAVDLVTLEYNSSNNSIIKKFRNKNAFPSKTAPNGMTANTNENQIIVDWILK